MLVNIMIWRQRTGTFKCIKLSKSETGTDYSLRVFVSSLYFVFCCLLQVTLGIIASEVNNWHLFPFFVL